MDDKTLDTAGASSRPAADPAPPGWRLLAFVYDAVPLLALLMIASGVLVAINGGRTVEHAPALAALEFVTFLAVCGAYFVASWRRGGQTLGMRPWRLKLVALDGRMATTRALVLRYVVACATPVLGWGWCLMDPQKRALCDLAAGTVLVRMRGGKDRG
ncbi:RDD family protein [soil metagenome]